MQSKSVQHITFVGGGNMANAMVSGLMRANTRSSNTQNPALIVELVVEVIEPDVSKHAELMRNFAEPAGTDWRFTLAPSIAQATLASGVIVLAVKPQSMEEVAIALRTRLGESVGRQLFISIAAGVRCARLVDWLGLSGNDAPRLVRCMPNTPALIGQGITGMSAPTPLTAQDIALAEYVLGCTGETLWVEQENMLDAVTAVSGSGPAYVFYFIEAMQAAAEKLGFSQAQARQLSLATFRGAANLAAGSLESASILRERVTSKGGTTAAALTVMQEQDLAAQFAQAIYAAQKRSEELGKS
jgi:pyrroline-5-carboxylate reductase